MGAIAMTGTGTRGLSLSQLRAQRSTTDLSRYPFNRYYFIKCAHNGFAVPGRDLPDPRICPLDGSGCRNGGLCHNGCRGKVCTCPSRASGNICQNCEYGKGGVIHFPKLHGHLAVFLIRSPNPEACWSGRS